MRKSVGISRGSLFGFVERRRRRLEQHLLLLRELLRKPRDVGSICPSSRALAEEMASALSPSFRRGFIVELGAGTGPVTDALLRRGVEPRKLVAIEKSEDLAQCLRRKFPGVNVLCCGAEDVNLRLGGVSQVRAIVSSLPFRSLPAEVGEEIMSEVEKILAPGGLFVQFTYALLGEMPFVPRSFRKIRSKVVLRNIPPAKVEVFRKPRKKRDIPGLETDFEKITRKR
jgi:phospholipid N-methyltransferase